MKTNGIGGVAQHALVMRGGDTSLPGAPLPRDFHERDTDPDITIDLEVTKTFVRPGGTGRFARVRTWLAKLLARMSWRMMP